MDPRPLRVLLWTGLWLVAVELGLEVRAVSRGWEGLLLGREPGWSTSTDPAYGPDEGFPFRSLRTTPEERAGLRVWVASSSYGEDIELEPPAVFPNRAVAHLAQTGVEAEVLNASHAGTTVGDNTRELRERGPRWRPDVVLLYQMSNDIDQASERVAAAASVGERATPGQGEAAPVERPSPVALWVERFTAYKHLKTQVTTRLAAGRPMRDTLGAEGEALFEADVRAFVAAARELGATPVLCTFATRAGPEALDGVPGEVRQQMRSMNMVLSLVGWADSVERFNGVLRRLAAEEGLALVDVAAELGGRAELFRDFWHFTPEGHDRVAALLARTLAGL